MWTITDYQIPVNQLLYQFWTDVFLGPFFIIWVEPRSILIRRKLGDILLKIFSSNGIDENGDFDFLNWKKSSNISKNSIEKFPVSKNGESFEDCSKVAQFSLNLRECNMLIDDNKLFSFSFFMQKEKFIKGKVFFISPHEKIYTRDIFFRGGLLLNYQFVEYYSYFDFINNRFHYNSVVKVWFFKVVEK